MNEQEQAIAKIQQTLDYCIQQTLRSLEDTIERKAEVLPVNDLAEVERSEYTHTLDELAAIYSKFPAVRSIKNYLHLPNYLWESTFIESLTMEEKRKWFHNHSLATYDDFCKDNTFIKAFDAIDLSKKTGRTSAAGTNIANSQYVVSLHRDSKSGIVHMHLDCNRIDMNGNVNDDHDIGIRATMAANEVTRQRGWVQADQRSDENKERITLDGMNALKVMSRFSWDVYVQKLAAKGYDLKLRYDSKGVVRGYTVRIGNSIYKSSELGKGRNLMPSKIESTWRKLHPLASNENQPHLGQSDSPRHTAIPQPKVLPKAEKPIYCLRKVDVDGHTYSIEIPEKALDTMKDEVASFKVNDKTADHIIDVALLLFASYIGAATSMSESCGGGETSPSSGWGKDDEDDWEWAKRCAQMAHSMVTTSKPKIRRSRGR